MNDTRKLFFEGNLDLSLVFDILVLINHSLGFGCQNIAL